MASKKKDTGTAAPPPSMPPMPPTAHHTTPAPAVAVEAAHVQHVDTPSGAMEAHPVGTAQYIAELEAEAAQHLTELEAFKGRITEGFKHIAATAITHAAQMAGHLPMDINAIPGIDAINAASGSPQ